MFWLQSFDYNIYLKNYHLTNMLMNLSFRNKYFVSGFSGYFNSFIWLAVGYILPAQFKMGPNL